MLDLKYIRENANQIKEAIKNKKINLDLDLLLQIVNQKQEKQAEIEKLRSQRNEVANTKGQKPSLKQIEKGKELKEKINNLEQEFKNIDQQYLDLMVKVPNVPSKDTPIGKNETENVEIFRSSLPEFDFEPKDYMILAKDLDLIDFDRGVKVSGYRGYYVKNDLVMLQMGLMMYALEKLIAKGFTPFIPPTLIREFALFGSGYFTGKEYNPEVDEIYKVTSRDKKEDGSDEKESKFLIGTAEPSLLAYYANEILDEKDLPLKFCGFSQCYRSEIGSYGRDTKGIYRVHEFMKVEQVAIMPADVDLSNQMHDEYIKNSIEMHEELGIPHRQIQICTGDLGAGKYKQYDMEAYIPSLKDGERQGWAETGSASNFLDWQSRRLNVKYKDKNGDKKYVYMLNNTAIPSARFIIAILENYQQADGSIVVPDVLRKYIGKSIIK